ncbi:unnamed protein product [Sympodiomycopsis kandeliae]
MQSMEAKYKPWHFRHILLAVLTFDSRRVGANPLRQTSSSTISAALVRWARSSKPIHLIRIEDILPGEDIKAIEKLSEESSERMEKDKDLLGEHRQVFRSLRRFLSEVSYHMALRDPQISREDAFSLLRKMVLDADDKPTCKNCGVCLTWQRKCEVAEGQPLDVHPSNLSPDRRTPGRRGGQYTEDNVDLLCLGCNMVKWISTVEDARLVFHALVQGSCRLDEAGLLEPLSLLTANRPFSMEDEENIERWATSALVRVNTSSQSSPRKAAMAHSLRKQDLKRMMEQLYIPGSQWQRGGYMGPLGAILPLEMAGVDRLDSDLGHTPDNCRRGRRLSGSAPNLEKIWSSCNFLVCAIPYECNMISNCVSQSHVIYLDSKDCYHTGSIQARL